MMYGAKEDDYQVIDDDNRPYPISPHSSDQSKRRTQKEIQGMDVREWVKKSLKEGRKPRHKEHSKLLERDPDIINFVRNLDKNAFTNIVLLSDHRVILQPTIGGDSNDGYIHASHVIMNQSPYILTQTPMSNTVLEFWRCVWQEQVRLIVSFNEPNEYQYWPLRKKFNFGAGKRYTITTRDVREKEGYDEYHLTIICREKKKEEERIVHLLHYKKWSHKLPDLENMINFMNDFWKIETECKTTIQSQNNQPAPTLVQCRTGVIASATFVSISAICKQLNRSGRADPVKIVRKLRGQRYGSIESDKYYIYIYLCFIHFALRNGMIRKNKDYFSFTRSFK